jgi:hypothetical protein
MALRRILPVLVVAAGLLIPARSASAGDVESQVFSMINAGRGHALILHHGLLQDAESHSAHMARQGNLDHDDAQQRVEDAPPDPPEGNGAPDDGFDPYGWCENATYVVPAQGDPATAIYNNWKNSPPHNACMNDTGKNVGAVGVYWDGSTYWATFVAEIDGTPPGGASSTNGAHAQDVTNPSQPTQVHPQTPEGITAPAKTAPPAASSSSSTHPSTPRYVAPAVTIAPSPTPPAAEVVVARPQTDLLSRSPTEDTSQERGAGSGLPELAGVVAAFLVGCLVLKRRLREEPHDGDRRGDRTWLEELVLSSTSG